MFIVYDQGVLKERKSFKQRTERQHAEGEVSNEGTGEL